MKRSHLISATSIVLASTLGLATVASAADGDDGGRRGRHHLTDEQKCEHQDRIRSRAMQLQERLATRVENVEALRTRAEEAGNTERVARFDRVLERLAALQQRLVNRIDGFEVWVVEHCDAPTTPGQ